MQLGEEKQEVIYKFMLDISPEETTYLRDLGLQRIQNDYRALIEYAVVSLLEEKVKEIPIEDPKESEDIEWPVPLGLQNEETDEPVIGTL